LKTNTEGYPCLLSSGALVNPVRHRTATVSCSVRDFLPNRAQTTVAAPGPLVHRTVRCPPPTVGATTRLPQISRPTVGAGDRWLTVQSGAPPDSSVNYSRTPPSNPESGEFTADQPAPPDTVRCTTGHCPVCQAELDFGCTHPCLLQFDSLLLSTVSSTWINHVSSHKTIHQV
jgi:hypothetical protein